MERLFGRYERLCRASPDLAFASSGSRDPGKKYITLRVKSARIPYLREVTTKYHLSVASWLDWQTEASGLQRGTSVIAPNEKKAANARAKFAPIVAVAASQGFAPGRR